QASSQCSTSYVMAGLMVVVADTDEEAKYLFTSVQQQFMNMRRGINRPFARPVSDLSTICTDADQAMLAHILRYALVGSPQTVADKLNQFVEATEVDELIVSMPIHDIQARLKSAEMFAQTGLMSR
ncbi:MAG: alkane 1-monooxygenase, partial [Glaciecola sp.]